MLKALVIVVGLILSTTALSAENFSRDITGRWATPSGTAIIIHDPSDGTASISWAINRNNAFGLKSYKFNGGVLAGEDPNVLIIAAVFESYSFEKWNTTCTINGTFKTSGILLGQFPGRSIRMDSGCEQSMFLNCENGFTKSWTVACTGMWR